MNMPKSTNAYTQTTLNNNGEIVREQNVATLLKKEREPLMGV
jgi:hypothetical protein